ncbi:glutamyl-Q tRNA(Asp) synthetase [Haloferula luteola]|uniref:Glutamyl-Q tRNA(Asp) synthetase n=1 Tax=Haloferula luteola TaxID=595692 RepID=A0A840V883_9BACT|nr:tRNA glutamyl-Q(34) synthetase GluQRS [Haloferula luteola]MBB5350160.1 glutamyl-Q tRNA(Asp) synthetase [Haloferula luteola]
MITRFAPSPTGLLHLGHAYAAWVAAEWARRAGGQFLLRFEDIDHTRVRENFYTAASEDLAWLGFAPDAPPIRQLDRSDAYDQALARLRELRVVYPCFCTRKEIEAEIASMSTAPQGPEGPLYPGTCRQLSPDDQQRFLAAGREPTWRIDAHRAAAKVGRLHFHDGLHGEMQVDPSLLGDAVLARRDIGTSYHLAVVTDDAWQKITHVTRGDDLLPSTHLHRVLQTLLGHPAPLYLHHPLVTDAAGRRLAKRDDARSIRAYRESGLSPTEIRAMLPPLPLCVSETRA